MENWRTEIVFKMCELLEHSHVVTLREAAEACGYNHIRRSEIWSLLIAVLYTSSVDSIGIGLLPVPERSFWSYFDRYYVTDHKDDPNVISSRDYE